MESHRKAQYIRRRLAIRDSLNKVKKYALIGTAVLGFAYLADKCNAGSKIEKGASKARNGIEYVLHKL